VGRSGAGLEGKTSFRALVGLERDLIAFSIQRCLAGSRANDPIPLDRSDQDLMHLVTERRPGSVGDLESNHIEGTTGPNLGRADGFLFGNRERRQGDPVLDERFARRKGAGGMSSEHRPGSQEDQRGSPQDGHIPSLVAFSPHR